jgi:hypothetical protein
MAGDLSDPPPYLQSEYNISNNINDIATLNLCARSVQNQQISVRARKSQGLYVPSLRARGGSSRHLGISRNSCSNEWP